MNALQIHHTSSRQHLHGRQKGRPLSGYRATLIETLLPRLAIDVTQPPPARLGDLFPRTPVAVHLEIGFGAGDHLAWRAERQREIGFIGVEPFVNGMAAMLSRLDAGGIDNIRLYSRDAVELLDWLPAASIDRVDILYPDPWRKRRHWKRRIVSADNLRKLAGIIPSGGTLRLATDWADYADWMLWHTLANGDFEWLAERACDWREPWPDWPSTRYEKKALQAGRKPNYLAFRRR